MRNKVISPLPFVYYFVPFLVIAAIGLGDSIYLAVSHYRVHTDIGYSSFCAVSRALNCDTVSSSPYAVFMGLPVAVWGILGYALVMSVILLAGTRPAQKQRFWPLLFWISLIYSISSLILAAVSTILINSYCIMCILTYLVNFALLYYAWFINKRFGDAGLFKGLIKDAGFLWKRKKLAIFLAAGFLVCISALAWGMPKYWKMDSLHLIQEMRSGNTENGHPWIGAENPELVIEEFTDYFCTQCRIKHFFLRRLIAEHPGKIRLIHRHFPMDHTYNPTVSEPYHVGAGVFALFSIYAQAHDKFWEANDLFFQMDKSIGAIGSKKIAETLGLSPGGLAGSVTNRHILYQLQKDIEKGLELNLTGTPAYVINGEVYQGYVPPRFLEKFIE